MSPREYRRQRRMERREYSGSGNGRIWTGLFLLIIGGVALLKAMMFPIPEWLFSWQVLLIIIGLFSGLRSRFENNVWIVLILIGTVFLLDDFFPGIILRTYLWPLAIIALGVFFIIKPRHRHFNREEQDNSNTPDQGNSNMGGSENTFAGKNQSWSEKDFIDSTSFFGGTKKNIVSKNFRGGDITNIFGGCEIDLTQADISGTVKLDLTQIFGGTKLVVPSNWLVKVEMDAFFGGVDDKRRMQNVQGNADKTLILHGTSIFGGIEIQSY